MSKKRDRNKGIERLDLTGALPVSEQISLEASRKGRRRWLIAGVIAFLSIGALGAGLKFLEENARQEKRVVSKDRSFLYSINPFAPPLPTGTPQLSREYIYAGSRLLAVEDATANTAPPADLAIWRRETGEWWVRDDTTGWYSALQGWGEANDTPTPGDYDGDGKTDFAVIRPNYQNTGVWRWYIIHSSNNTIHGTNYSIAGDLHAQADYDGDGKTDMAVYRPTDYTWYIQGSTLGFYTVVWNSTIGNGIPASADYDGDGRADLALWRSSDSTFYSKNSSNNATVTISMGHTGTPVSADYDGDGKADYALYSDLAGYWYVRQSSTASISSIAWGDAGEFEWPVQNDYDGDGKVDIAVWRNSNGYWYVRQSAHGFSTRTVGWGQPADIPVPAFYRR